MVGFFRRAAQREWVGGGGANGAIPRFARDPQLKGAPKFARGGGQNV
jgi:hypothetical protein